MANLKNKKSNVAKKTATAATTTPVQASQTAAPQAAEKKTSAKVEEKAAAAPEKEKAAGVQVTDTKAAAPKTAAADSKTAGAKKAPAKRTAAKRTTRKTAKKAEPIQEVFYEYAGEQILTEELVSRIKEQYKSEGHRVGAIKSLRVYINPEHRKAYYVINDKAEGSFIEF